MNHRSIIFCGTSDFAVPSLEMLLADPSFDVTLVISQPDRAAGRMQHLVSPPVKSVAEQRGTQIFQPSRLTHELLTISRLPRPDFLVVVSFGQLLPRDVLAFPLVEPINVHASLLPRWRGASPIHQAILAGDPESGVTIQQMVPELDAGPILAQEHTPIAPRETYRSLHDRLATMGASLLRRTLLSPLTPRPQEGEVTHCRKLTREDGLVDPQRMTAEDIDRRVRALVPWPGVLLEIDGKKLKLIEASLEPTSESVPLPCTDGTVLHLVRVQPPGRTAMTGTEWQRGQR